MCVVIWKAKWNWAHLVHFPIKAIQTPVVKGSAMVFSGWMADSTVEGPRRLLGSLTSLEYNLQFW